MLNQITIIRATSEQLDDTIMLFASYRQFYGLTDKQTASRNFIQERLESRIPLSSLPMINNKLAGLYSYISPFLHYPYRPQSYSMTYMSLKTTDEKGLPHN